MASVAVIASGGAAMVAAVSFGFLVPFAPGLAAARLLLMLLLFTVDTTASLSLALQACLSLALQALH